MSIRLRSAHIALTLLWGSFVVAAHSAEPRVTDKLVSKEILDGKVTLSVPASFKLMSDEMRQTKYPNANRPEVVYTDPRGTVNLAFSLTPQPLEPEQIAAAQKALDQQFRATFPTAVWHESKVFERDGRKYFMLDLTTPAPDTTIRNTLVGTSLQGRLFMVTFNVTKELEAQWLPLGQKSLATLKVHD
jgi:hypothetical protein